MLIDLHVHTSRYSACGRSTPEEMAARAATLGYDAIVLTEHHAIWSAEDAAALERRCPGLRVFRGVEATSVDGDDFLLFGGAISDGSNRDGTIRNGAFPAGMEDRRIVEYAHAHGAVVVLAHPYRFRDRVPQVVEDGLVDGVEVLSNNILVANHERASELAIRTGSFAVAATDAHHVSTLGLYGIGLQEPVASEDALADALLRRAFELYVDTERVAASNAAVAQHMAEVLDLIAQGCDDRTIRERVPGMHGIVIQGLRRGVDVRRAMDA